nr:6605_t:CDS:2 [Entrophospora candida]
MSPIQGKVQKTIENSTGELISVESKASKLCKSPADAASPRHEDEEKKINGDIYRASIHAKDAIMYSGIYLMVEVVNCTIQNSVSELESIMKLHQTLISIRGAAIDYLNEAGYSTSIRTKHLDWINPTATTSSKKITNLRIFKELSS